jgi:hypothetical protein
MPLIEFPEKRSSHDRAILERSFQSGQMECAEFRVRMLEDKHIASRERGTVIHLFATTGFSEIREPRSVRSRNLFGVRIA